MHTLAGRQPIYRPTRIQQPSAHVPRVCCCGIITSYHLHHQFVNIWLIISSPSSLYRIKLS